jgi:hypothetical protein
MGSQHYDQDHQRPRSNRPEGRRPGRSARRVLHLDAGPWSVSRGKLATRRGTLRASPVVRSDEATARLAHDQLRAACCWRAINPGKPRSLTVHCAAGPSQVGAPDYAPGSLSSWPCRSDPSRPIRSPHQPKRRPVPIMGRAAVGVRAINAIRPPGPSLLPHRRRRPRRPGPHRRRCFQQAVDVLHLYCRARAHLHPPRSLIISTIRHRTITGISRLRHSPCVR